MKQSSKIATERIPRTDHLTGEELSRLFDEVGREPDLQKRSRNKAIYYLLFFYGLRPAEVVRIKLADLDLDKKTINLHRSFEGSGTFPLREDVREAVEEWMNVRSLEFKGKRSSSYLFPNNRNPKEPFTEAAAYYTFRQYARAASIPTRKRKPYTLRNTVGVQLASQGATLEDINIALDLPPRSVLPRLFLSSAPASKPAVAPFVIEIPRDRPEIVPAVLAPPSDAKQGESNVENL